MKSKGLYEKLIEYGKDGNYGFHMPGHKRNISLLEGMDPFDIDITEIDGFDNLHHAEGIIKNSMGNAARFFGTEKTWFLVNGSTSGILAAINAVTDIGDSIIIGRNCHKSVYNAVEIRNLKVEYLYPEFVNELGINGGYNPQKLEELLRNNQKIKAVVITSPTYDGMVSDIESLAKVTHKHDAVLIVDEAHGAHFGISEGMPTPAYKLGADLIIESVHKTLPAMTQTALLHLKGDRVSGDKVEECLGIYQSSSPSYVLMASIDKCISQLQTTGKEDSEKLLTTVKYFRNKVNKSRHIRIPGTEIIGKSQIFDVDETKLIIYVEGCNISGKQLADILRDRYHFEMEMSCEQYTLAITTICDNYEEIKRLANALLEIDKEIKESERRDKEFYIIKNKIKYSVYEAKKAIKEIIALEDAEGRVSGEYLYLYPPGSPLLVPGEVISKELLEQILRFKQLELNINGLKDKQNEHIEVIKDKFLG